MRITTHRGAARYLIGRTIASVSMGAWRDGTGTHTEPIITLDDGSSVRFMATETESGGEYGVSIIRRNKR